MLLIEDDIHFIHAIPQPTRSQTSTAWHTCTGLLDVQEKMPAVSMPSDSTKLHRRAPVIMKNGVVKQCTRGADVQSVLQYFASTLREFFASSYLGTLSIEHRRVDMSNMKQSCENPKVGNEKLLINQVVFLGKVKIIMMDIQNGDTILTDVILFIDGCKKTNSK